MFTVYDGFLARPLPVVEVKERRSKKHFHKTTRELGWHFHINTLGNLYIFFMLLILLFFYLYLHIFTYVLWAWSLICPKTFLNVKRSILLFLKFIDTTSLLPFSQVDYLKGSSHLFSMWFTGHRTVRDHIKWLWKQCAIPPCILVMEQRDS